MEELEKKNSDLNSDLDKTKEDLKQKEEDLKEQKQDGDNVTVLLKEKEDEI